MGERSERPNCEQDADEPQDPLAMSRVASEATDLTSLPHASKASDRPNREQDVDELQGPLAMTKPLSHTQAKRASDLTASKTSTNRRTPLAMPGQFPKRKSSPRLQPVLLSVRPSVGPSVRHALTNLARANFLRAMPRS